MNFVREAGNLPYSFSISNCREILTCATGREWHTGTTAYHTLPPDGLDIQSGVPARLEVELKAKYSAELGTNSCTQTLCEFGHRLSYPTTTPKCIELCVLIDFCIIKILYIVAERILNLIYALIVVKRLRGCFFIGPL